MIFSPIQSACKFDDDRLPSYHQQFYFSVFHFHSKQIKHHTYKIFSYIQTFNYISEPNCTSSALRLDIISLP